MSTGLESIYLFVGLSVMQSAGSLLHRWLSVLSSFCEHPSMREEIKRTPVQDKMVCSSGIGMNIEKKELEINGKIIAFRYQAFKALKLLFEKINTHVPTDDLYVAVYEGKAGDWHKSSLQERKCFYFLGEP
jgi:hypothetical protein